MTRRKTSSRLGCSMVRPCRRMPAASSARTSSGTFSAARPKYRRSSRPPTWRLGATAASAASALAASADEPNCSSTTSSPTSRLRSLGVPCATILPLLMMAISSARRSASSRYCVVRKIVMPKSSLRRRTSSQIAARLAGSSPVVGSSRNRMRGSCTSARARSSRRLMPPEYAPARFLGSTSSRPTVTSKRSAVLRASSRGVPNSSVCSMSSSRDVISGSRPTSCKATPIASRTLPPCFCTS